MEEQIVGTRAWAFWLRNHTKVGIRFPMSSIEWRKLYPNENDCPVCHGANGRTVQAKDGKVYQCVCLMPTWGDEQIKLRDTYQTRYEPASLNDVDYRKTEKNSKDLLVAMSSAEHFIFNLDKWLVLSGGFGTGKTHIARSIATMLRPISFFITATDFEKRVFQGLDDNALEDFLQKVSQAAVLIFDDFGAEYGSDIVKSKIASVFIARDHRPLDYPTVVTTNLTRSGIAKVERVGSRLLSEDNCVFLPIGMSDYRQRGYEAMNPEGRKVKW